MSAPDSAASPLLPPRHRLLQLARSLSQHLPRQLAGLVDHPRFAAGAAALARLGEEGRLGVAVAAMPEKEAAFLAEVLLQRWRAVADPVLDPMAGILAPTEVWMGVEPVRLTVEVVVAGALPDWEAVWDGATPIAGSNGARAALIVDPDANVAACRAHVRARTAQGRVALTAQVRIAVRRPQVTVREDRRRLVVVDQLGVPAVGVALRIGEVEHLTGAGGLLELGQPAARGAALCVQGIPAGRIADQLG